MSGKQDKASRRLMKSVEEETQKNIDALEEAGKYDKAQFVIEIIRFQRTMPFWERVKLAISILFAKYWWAVCRFKRKVETRIRFNWM
mgnify:CR=1 FL=1